MYSCPQSPCGNWFQDALWIPKPTDAQVPYIKCSRASLVAQRLRIHLPMQGTRVRALVREDPTSCGATKPMHHNY